jgi:hypothetical protein
MPRTVWFRAFVLSLAVTVLASPVFAAGGPKTSRREVGVVAFLWQTLGKLVPAIGKSSGTMDPDGTSMLPPSGAATQGDSSGTMDPDGVR